MNFQARQLLVMALLCACTGGPTTDFPSSPDGEGDGDQAGGDGGLSTGDGDGDSSNEMDAGVEFPTEHSDGGTGPDAGDAGLDGSLDNDAGDASIGGLGTLSGDLDVLGTAAAPAVFVNHLDLGTTRVDNGFSDAEVALLTPAAQALLDTAAWDYEALGLDVLVRAEGATLLKTRNDMDYDPPGLYAPDYLAEIAGVTAAVDTTRARSFPLDDPYTAEEATALLQNHLDGLQLALANVADGDRWTKSILHVIAYAEDHASVLRTVYEALPAETKANAILLITVTDGNDEFLY
ncbi:MAG: hypothetical protein QM778_19185 [Myxococcales bacterium]